MERIISSRSTPVNSFFESDLCDIIAAYLREECQMINFPEWVTTPKGQSEEKLASKRLKYIICRAALEKLGAGNITAFGRAINLESTTLHLYVKLGAVSKVAAERAEKAFGRKLIRAKWLTNPLEIEEASE
jgi:hypothetical protein